MTLTTRVLTALIVGLAIGVGVSLLETPWMFTAVTAVEPIGALWVNAIRMTVIPLVVSLLITGIASASGASAGRIGGRAFIWFVVLVAGGALFTALAAPPLLSLVDFDASAFASLRASAPTAQVELPPFRDWIVGLIPANPVKAAADGTMLPLIVFACMLAIALTQLDAARRQVLVGFFDAVSGAMMVIVEWVLITAPIGVFFLVLPLAANTGVELVGAFGFFLLVACGLVTVALLALYPVAVVFGGVSLRDFARACAPAQAVAFSTRSSLASLPAMLDAAKRDLGLPEQVSSLVLPAAVAVFKYGSPVARATGTIFVAHLYGIDLGFVGIATITAAIAGLSFYSPGVPSGGLFVMTPIYIALNLPVEGIGLMIALDLIPDMFITTANVTADLTVATILGRGEATPGREREPADLQLDPA
jgi:Na+/H+-dicarboxylate symporter